MRQFSLRIFTLMVLTNSCSVITGNKEDDPTQAVNRVSASAYLTVFTPADLSISFPTSLSQVESFSLVTEDPPLAGEAHGYNKLRDLTNQTQNQLAQLQVQLMNIDAAGSQILDRCGEDEQCSIESESICVNFSAEMARNVQDSVGEHAFTKEEFDELDSAVNTQKCLPAMEVGYTPDSEDGYLRTVKLIEDNGDTIEFKWSEDRTKVKAIHSFTHGFKDFKVDAATANADDVPEPILDIFEGISVIVFDANLKKVNISRKVKHSFGTELDSFEENWTAESVEDKADIKQVKIKGSFTNEHREGKNRQSFTALADDRGGILEENIEDYVSHLNNIALSEPTEPEVDYSVVPLGTELKWGKDFWEAELGHIRGNGSPSPDQVNFNRELPSDLSQLAIVRIEHSSTGSDPNIIPTPISLLSVDFNKDVFRHFFKEQWDELGNLIGQCHKDENQDGCGNQGEIFTGEHNDEFKPNEFNFDDAKYKMVNVNQATVRDFPDTPPLMLFLAKKDLTTFPLHSPEFEEAIVGFAHYELPPESTDFNSFDQNNYRVMFHGQVPSNLANIKVFVEKIELTTGQLKIIKLSASVQSK